MAYLSNEPGTQLTPEEQLILSEVADLGSPGQVLAVNISGTGVEYIDVPSGAPGGSDTYVQFNDAGSFGGDAGFTYDKAANLLSLETSANAAGSSASGLSIRNTDATGYTNTIWRSSTSAIAQMLMAGPSFVNGVFLPNSASFYTDGTGGLLLGASNATGTVRLFAGGYSTVNVNATLYPNRMSVFARDTSFGGYDVYTGTGTGVAIKNVGGTSPEIDFYYFGSRRMVFGYDGSVDRGIFYNDFLGMGVFFFDNAGIAIGGSTTTFEDNNFLFYPAGTVINGLSAIGKFHSLDNDRNRIFLENDNTGGSASSTLVFAGDNGTGYTNTPLWEMGNDYYQDGRQTFYLWDSTRAGLCLLVESNGSVTIPGLPSSTNSLVYTNAAGTLISSGVPFSAVAYTRAKGDGSRSSALATTSIMGGFPTGMYRVSVYLHVRTAATVSSVLGGATGVVLTFNDGFTGAAQTVTMALSTAAGGTAINDAGNTTAVVLNGVASLYMSSGANLTYAIGYTSVGATSMVYDYKVTVEYVNS